MVNGVFALLLSLTGVVVVDGDTFKVDGDRYRIWGIDAPERSDPGDEASINMLRKLVEGQTLECSWISRDRYGRDVVRCFLPQGVDIACEMVRTGNAVDWPRFSGGYYARCDR